jgi:hypothetical protein
MQGPMRQVRKPVRFRPAQRRRGLTLTELLVATTIMIMIAGAMGTLAMTVHSANDYCRAHILSAQHARVSLDRIEQALEDSLANEQFPACLVVAEQAGSQELPDTLVIWRPQGAAANPSGLPLIRELVVFAPDPGRPNCLMEIRAPEAADPVPPPSDTSAWRTLTNLLRTSQTTEKIILTDRLRTAPLDGSWNEALTPAELRGVVRFRRVMAPSQEEWDEYRAATRAWNQLSWPLDSYRSTSGTRAVSCQTELQIVAGQMASAASTAVPFFGSALRTYELPR